MIISKPSMSQTACVILSMIILLSCQSSANRQDGSELAAARSPKYQTGQIIGISEAGLDPSTFFFEVATRSRFGHVGVVIVIEKETYVYHITPESGVQASTIQEFLSRASFGGPVESRYFSVVGPSKQLTSAEKRKLVEFVTQLKDRRPSFPYNFSQVYDDKSKNGERFNCSEFVRFVFAGIGREVGSVETTESLNAKAFSGLLLPLWEKVTGIASAKGALYVTPASVMRDTDFERVSIEGSSGLDNQTDMQILDGWRDAAALPALAFQFSQIDPKFPSEGGDFYRFLQDRAQY